MYKLVISNQSSCSRRVLLGLSIKGIKIDVVERSEIEQDANEPVPILYDITNDLRLTQSMVILEYLDQKHPNTPKLYPTDPLDNIRVRELVQIIVSDIQPLQTRTLLSKLNEESGKEIIRYYIDRGLQRYDRMMDQDSDYSVGNQLTAADIALYPQCQNAKGYDIELSNYPNIFRVVTNLEKTYF